MSAHDRDLNRNKLFEKKSFVKVNMNCLALSRCISAVIYHTPCLEEMDNAQGF